MSMIVLLNSYDISMRLRWDLKKDLYGIPMIFLEDFFGISMVVL